MEASHVLGGIEDEEYSSSESGWTMYIGSSIHDYDHYNYIGEIDDHCDAHKSGEGCRQNQCRNYDGNIQKRDDESDDSMASDASSGPSDLKLPCCSEQNRGIDHYKHEKFKPTRTEKLHKQVMKRGKSRNKIDKEKLEVETISAASHVRSKDKTK